MTLRLKVCRYAGEIGYLNWMAKMFWKIKKMGDSLRDLWAAFATFVVKIKFLPLSDKKDTHLLKHLSIAGISPSP